MELCREWGLDPQGSVTVADDRPAGFCYWETFRPESLAAIRAYIAALEQHGYRVLPPEPAQRD